MKNKKILIADRSHACARLAEQYLQNIGIQKENIVTVKEGSRLAELLKAQLFDVIIIDPMRLGIETVDIIDHVNTTQNDPKIVEYTGGLLGHEKNEIFHEVIFKPTNQQDFCRAILHVLNATSREIQ